MIQFKSSSGNNNECRETSLLERSGISIETLDMYELFGWVNDLADDDVAVARKLDEIKAYVSTKGVPSESLVRIAKLGFAIDRWMADLDLHASAIQCWTAMEQFYGVVPCTVMSVMSNSLVPSACETDIAGAVGMYAMTLASGKPSAIVDWNNNYGSDPDKGVVFHCSNLPKDIFVSEGAAPDEIPLMDYQEIIAGTVGKENAFGTIVEHTETGLELHWQAENPSDYPNYVHIGTPPVIGADGFVYGLYEDTSITEATIALPKGLAEWTTTVAVPDNVTGLYVLVSVETRQSKYFVSYVIDITDR